MKKVLYLLTLSFVFLIGANVASAASAECNYAKWDIKIENNNLSIVNELAPYESVNNKLSVSDFKQNGKLKCLDSIYIHMLPIDGNIKYTISPEKKDILYVKYALETSSYTEDTPNTDDNSNDSNTTNNSSNANNSNTTVKNTYTKLQCGDEEMPYVAAQIVRTVIVILEIATPVLIIVLGMVDLLKGVIAQKEDEIKKGQQTFIRRLVIGALVFLAFVLVQFIIGFVTNVLNEESENKAMWNCTNCFINGKCDKVIIDVNNF